MIAFIFENSLMLNLLFFLLFTFYKDCNFLTAEGLPGLRAMCSPDCLQPGCVQRQSSINFALTHGEKVKKIIMGLGMQFTFLSRVSTEFMLDRCWTHPGWR